MKKLKDLSDKELLKKRFPYDLTSNLMQIPTIIGGALFGNGIIKHYTPHIIAGSTTAVVAIGTAIFCAGMVEKIDKIRKERKKQSEKEHNDRIYKIQHNYQESDIISEDYKEIE